MTETQDLIQSLTVETLRDALQACGYRAEIVATPPGTAQLRSSTAGMTFDIRMGSRWRGDIESFSDFAFFIVFTVRGGALPDDLLNKWNNAYRFGRLRLDQNLLILEMDVSVAGGISHRHLQAQLGVWEQLLQGFITYLRGELPRLNGAAAKTMQKIGAETTRANVTGRGAVNISPPKAPNVGQTARASSLQTASKIASEAPASATARLNAFERPASIATPKAQNGAQTTPSDADSLETVPPVNS